MGGAYQHRRKQKHGIHKGDGGGKRRLKGLWSKRGLKVGPSKRDIMKKKRQSTNGATSKPSTGGNGQKGFKTKTRGKSLKKFKEENRLSASRGDYWKHVKSMKEIWPKACEKSSRKREFEQKGGEKTGGAQPFRGDRKPLGASGSRNRLKSIKERER